MDIDEMMDYISSGEDYDEYVDLDEENEESEEFEDDEKNEVVLSDWSVISNLKQLSSGLLRYHDEFTKGSKLNLKTNIIPMVNICKIKNHWIINAIIFLFGFQFNHKIIYQILCN